MNSDTRKVPRHALVCPAGTVEFADGELREDATELPITMLARTGQPIEHWYWGRIVHDMSGMQLRKDTCPIDYCHFGRYDDDENIGVAEEFSADNKGLTISGRLISIAEGDRAAKLIARAHAGIPYESSIDFNGPMRLEELTEGTSAQVNGFTFKGPGYIVREWQLRSVAVCPYGADPRTRSQFSGDEPEEIEVTVFREGAPMPKSQTTKSQTKPKQQLVEQTATDNPTADPATQELTDQGVGKPATPTGTGSELSEEPPASDAQSEFTARLKKFVRAFGAENGAKWFAEDVSYEGALEKHVQVLTDQLKAKDEQIGELTQKLSSIDRGETQPLDFEDGEQTPAQAKAQEASAKVGDRLAAFAASFKMPGEK